MLDLEIPKKFYITTPIYYTSGRFHLGHAYTTICADVFARYYRLVGSDVFFLTGTDEHGQKVEDAAKKEGILPKEFVDNLVSNAKQEWKSLDISYDAFIRTTDEKHISLVKEIASKMLENEDIYKGKYVGYYCKDCESFFTSKDIIKDKCPLGHNVKKETEEAYFFKISKYQKWLKQYILDNPKFLQTESNKNEILAFIDRGLEDLCISREKVGWGITLPFDENYTIYVWLDALFNYVSGIGGLDSDNFKKFWPPDFQVMGKEIFRFHAIYWPIFLKSLNLEIPKTEFAHGWWLSEGMKMSKSFNNVVYPLEYVKEYGSDIFRYYVIREISFGEDGSFSKKNFIERINSDLVANIGNLLSRVITLASKRNQETGYLFFRDESFVKEIENKIIIISKLYKNYELTKIINEIFQLSSLANKYVQGNKPWELLTEDPKKFDQVIYTLLETIRILAVELAPIFTTKWKEIFDQLGLDANNKDNLKLEFTNISEKRIVKKGNHLFKKQEIK
ncbi:MAG: methionine--tRNA ligase [archaeon]|nr:methionine--tRNA ligase [archaeon]MDD4220892.1 methionine--tRNA ligase [Candidatus ainarchaeum sp.]